MAAADLLKNDWHCRRCLERVTSFNLLNRDGRETARWNLLHPTETPREALPDVALAGPARARSSPPPTTSAPTLTKCANSPGRYTVLGTDGWPLGQPSEPAQIL